MKKKNYQILKYIWHYPGVARKELAAMFKFRPNLVTDIIRELIDEDWVSEGGVKIEGPGRAPISLHMNSQDRAAVAVTYDKNKLLCALVNAGGKVVNQLELPGDFKDADEITQAIAKCIEDLRSNFTGEVIGICVPLQGMIDRKKGMVVRSALFPHWRNVPLSELIAEKTGLPVLLDNNTCIIALGQYLLKPELRESGETMLYFNYSAGIGFATVTPEGVWIGAGFAGEVGHVILDPEGPVCGCGARGCLESLVKAQAIEERAQELLKYETGSVLQNSVRPCAEDIFKAAIEGDRMARRIVEDGIRHLELPLAFLVSAIHPRYLVVGAESKAAITYIVSRLKIALRNLVMPEIISSIEICEGDTVPELTLISAGLMVFDETIMHEGKGFIRSANKNRVEKIAKRVVHEKQVSST